MHNWVVVSDTGASCTQGGTRTWKCTLCGQTYSEATAPLGHKWIGKMTTVATCVEEGVKTYTCARCGTLLQAQEPIPALDHDWDEGAVTTEPHLFEPGVMTFTCKNDPSHTRTEEIDPTASLFAALRGGTVRINPVNIDPLIIVEQPQGGAITRYEDETHTMHVKAVGGTGEYTYEWHSESQDLGKQEQYNALLKWFVGLFGVTPEEVDEALEASFSDTDTCTVSQAGQKYYCIVTDEAGDTATSESALVRYRVRIAKQPDDVNLQLPDPTFYCLAADGSGDYTYRWFDSDMGILGEGQSFPATEHGICYCYCIVTDNVTGETVESEYCEVYDEEPFQLVRITEDCALWPEETGMVVAAFSGGTPDYEIWWDKDGTAIDSVEGMVDDHPGTHVDANGPGKYTVHAVDAHGEVIKATCTISEKHLTISKQPVGGNLPRKDGWLELTTEIEDGVAPYRFELYRNGTSYVGGESDSNTCTLTAWHSGLYNFYIEDSLGHSATSDYACVGNAVFRIKKQTDTGEISYPGGSAFLSVEAEGGLEPYTYLWSVRKDSNWYDTGDNSPYINVYTPGEYYCEVLDAEEDFVFSRTMTVTYTGAPGITEQPENTVAPDAPDGMFSTMLTCRAISGAGDDSTLQYNWEVRRQSTNRWALLMDSGPYYHATYTGTYRCRVYDTATGKHTYSDAAIVCHPLKCTYAQPWKSSNSTLYFYRASFTGGVGPYKVDVYIVNAEDAGHYPLYVRETKTVKTMDKLYLMKFLEPKYAEVWYTDPTQTREIKVGCCIDVIDAIEQLCESPYMEWK